MINVFKFNKFLFFLIFSLNIIKYVLKLEFNTLRNLSTKSLFLMIFKFFHFNLIAIIFEVKALMIFALM